VDGVGGLNEGQLNFGIGGKLLAENFA